MRWSCWPWSGSPASRPAGATPGAGDRPAHLEQAAVVGPGGELGAGDGDRGRAPGRVEQPAERLGRRRAVVVQQPEPRAGIGGGAVLLQPCHGQRHARAERGAAVGLQDGDREGRPAQRLGRRQEVGAGVRGPGVDDHEPVRPPALPATASSVSGSHAAPSRTTSTAVTVGGVGGAGVSREPAWGGAIVISAEPSGRRHRKPTRYVPNRPELDGALLQLAALALGQPAPDAETLVVGAGRTRGTRTGPRSPTQTFLASRVEPPFSGKNASGSVWAHRARSCQDSSPSSCVHLGVD